MVLKVKLQSSYFGTPMATIYLNLSQDPQPILGDGGGLSVCQRQTDDSCFVPDEVGTGKYPLSMAAALVVSGKSSACKSPPNILWRHDDGVCDASL